MAISLDHEIFYIIHQEHLLLKQKLALLLVNPNISKNDIEQFIYFVNQHHKKEESYLFRVMLPSPRLREGGPMCTIFFDLFNNSRPITKVESITKKPIPISTEQMPFYKNESPLQIPIDEHRSSYALLEYVLREFDNLSHTRKLAILEEYKKIEFLHLEKEESCLFHVSASILSEEQAQQIIQEWTKQ